MLWSWLKDNFGFIGSGLAVLAASQALTSFLRLRFADDSPSSYRVSFLGPPNAGKSTAIVALLDYVTNSELSGRVRLRGNLTIQALEEGIQQLSAGRFPSRTSEESTNIYRFDYVPPVTTLRRLLAFLIPVPRVFRVEVADFAGELNDRFSRDVSGASIANVYSENSSANFQKWVAESDCCLLFIDVERLIGSGDAFVNEITSQYVAFWQRYLDIHVKAVGPRSGTPASLVFAKCDLISDNSVGPSIEALMALESRFTRLTTFLENNSRRITSVFLSSVTVDRYGERFGAEDLADSVLPKPTPRINRKKVSAPIRADGRPVEESA